MIASLKILCAASGLFALCASFSMAAEPAGPMPVPSRVENWPGKGTAGVYPLWTERRAQFWADRKKDQGAVVFFGDSITQGWGARLQPSFPELKVANRGIGGDTSRRLLWRLQEDVLDLHPKAVVLLIGINDLADGVMPSDVAWNIRAIVDEIHRAQPKTPVILCHVMPWKENPPISPGRVEALNRLIDAIATGRPHVAVCDTFSVYATPEGLSTREEFPDLLHPNAAGYAKWAAALRPVMKRMGILR